MAIGHVITRGFGNGTFVGDINLVITQGYSIGAVPPVSLVPLTLPVRDITFELSSRDIALNAPARDITFKPLGPL